ncbi:MAG: tetratricopeptide repeat protein [Candidatus Firestonebacteria bacterium]|nr:tetratricopeptide repeat protein [Candidatus Firestonebacteria bacterium]
MKYIIMNYKIYCFMLFCFLFSISIKGQEIEKKDQYFALGNSFYEKTDYKKAIEEYDKIIKTGIKNGTVYYNLGNAYFKTRKIGKAIANYERAKLFLPRDTDLNMNLKFSRQWTRDKTLQTRSGIISLFLSWFTDFFTVNELAVTTSIIYFILLTIISFVVFLKKQNVSYMILIFSVILFFMLSSFIYKVVDVEYTTKGIVIEPEIKINSGPSSQNTLISTIHEGTKIEIIKQESGYYEIILPNGEKGWTQSDKIEII